jgi:hypothetical protein
MLGKSRLEGKEEEIRLLLQKTGPQRRPSPRLSGSRGPPFSALSRQGGYAHILKGYFYTNLVGTLDSATIHFTFSGESGYL